MLVKLFLDKYSQLKSQEIKYSGDNVRIKIFYQAENLYPHYPFKYQLVTA